eukprot:scaffold106017_cov80-Cyclotella_meneghiniana.AAC.5
MTLFVPLPTPLRSNHPPIGEQKMRTGQPGLGQMSPNASRRVSGAVGEFEGDRGPSYYGIVGEIA